MRLTALSEPGTGLLRVSGHLAEELVEAALVARSFLELHEAWLEATLGPLVLRPSSVSHDVRLHVDHTLALISGQSMGGAMLVTLASLYVGRAVVAPVGVLGKVSLSGGMSAVSDLGCKMLAMQRALESHALGPSSSRHDGPHPPSQQQQRRGESPVMVIVVPVDSVHSSKGRCRLWETSTGEDVRLPGRLLKKLSVVSVTSLFHCLELLLPKPPEGCAAAAGPGPRTPSVPAPLSARSSVCSRQGPGQLAGELAVVKVLLPDLNKEPPGWGQVQLVECGRLPRRPMSGSGDLQACHPSPNVVCTPSARREVVQMVDVGVAWLRQHWDLVCARLGAGQAVGAQHEHDLLHFNFPGYLVNGCVGAAAVVAAAAIWLGRAVPQDVAVIGETDASGAVVGRVGGDAGEDAETILRLAQFNGVRLVLVLKTEAISCTYCRRAVTQKGGVSAHLQSM